MKIDKNMAIILTLCFAALLILGYVASKGNFNNAHNNATINQSQTQNITNQNQTSGQIIVGNATKQNQTPNGNATILDGNATGLIGNTTNATWNTTNATRNATFLIDGPGTTITPPHPKNDTNQTNLTCSDTEALGIEYLFVAGTTTGIFNNTLGSYSDYCVGNELHYYVCEYPSAGLVVNGTYVCPINCSNGACVTSINSTNCTDSDGGLNLNLQGAINSSSGNISSDYCINDSVVLEYYCMNGMVNGMQYDCPYGCSNGACAIQANATNCTDSDAESGVYLYLQGTVETSSGEISMDYCISDSSLLEYYCQNGMAVGSEYACPDRCSNGACVFINISSIYESDFMVVDDSMPNLLTNQKFFEMPPPPGNNSE